MSRRQGIALSVAIVAGWSTYVGLSLGAQWGVVAWAAVWAGVAVALKLWTHAVLAAARLRLRREQVRSSRLRAERKENLDSFRALLAEHGIDASDVTDDQIGDALYDHGVLYRAGALTKREVAVGIVHAVRQAAGRQGGKAA